MKSLPWPVSGVRLHLPRDLAVTYSVGRMRAVTIADTFALWYGSPHTSRFGFGRLVRLGLLRAFPRTDPLMPAWYTLTKRGLEWTAEQAGCDEREIRSMESIRRVNLVALSMRNRLWTSLVLASRRHPSIRIGCFQPEWELRPQLPEHLHVVPDAIVSLVKRDGNAERRCAWALEMDNATERAAVWKTKTAQYADLHSVGDLYGIANWRLLASVPSLRRAHSVAAVITAGGAGAFSFVGLAASLEAGRAFDQVLWPCSALAKVPTAQPSASLIDGFGKPINEADQRGRSTVDRVSLLETGAITP
jgi:Replication-relaxation